MPYFIDLAALATLLGVAAAVAALLWPGVAELWTSAARRGLPRVGPYLLIDQLGAGGMGQVYRARHLGSGDWCALKLLPRAASERDRERFRREARLSSQLSHPNTVAVYDYGQSADGTPYYAMELVSGMTLQEVVERSGPQPEARVIDILLQLCAALDEVHRQGLVHRDIKPENILITAEGGVERVKLLDFGLVKQLDGDGSETAPSSVVGTPLYISPEAISAPRSVDARSDLYGLGAVAYFLLKGAPVFPGANVIEVCSHHLHTTPPPIMGVSPELERVVLECLAKDPGSRPQSAAALARRLRHCAQPTFATPSNDVVLPGASSVALLRSTAVMSSGRSCPARGRRPSEARACA